MTVDPAFKREQFRNLKRANDNGELIKAKRKSFGQQVRQALYDRQRGDCDACHEPLDGLRFDVDHGTELDLGGSNELSNLRALHPTCHRLKTSARAKDLAKAHRLHDATWEEPSDKPSRLQSRNEWPPKGTQKFPTRHSSWGLGRGR